MTWDQFEGQMARLKSVYTERAYPNERTKLLWSQVSDSDLEHFSKAVDRWIGELKFAPMLIEFREFYHDWMRQTVAERMLEKRLAISQDRACKYCGDEGQLLATRLSDNTIWAFLCSFCEAPRSRNMLTFKDENGKYIKRTFWRASLRTGFSLADIPKGIAHIGDHS